MRICISRTDSIGDVVLTLPLAQILKEELPHCEILFLGKTYTIPILNKIKSIDEVINYDEIQKYSFHKQVEFLRTKNIDVFIHVFPNKNIAWLAKKAKIPVRIGTSRRVFHWFTCNKRVSFSRKKSILHESQLNLKLLNPLIGEKNLKISSLSEKIEFSKLPSLKEEIKSKLDPKRFNLILHPKSQGSAVEWGTKNFTRLIELLPQDRFKIFITGTSKERELVKDFLEQTKTQVEDLTGKLSLDEFISFINESDGLVACSTGPLHLSSVLGKYTLGLYSEKRPIHSGRWGPIGKKSEVITNTDFHISPDSDPVLEIQGILPERVSEKVMNWVGKS